MLSSSNACLEKESSKGSPVSSSLNLPPQPGFPLSKEATWMMDCLSQGHPSLANRKTHVLLDFVLLLLSHLLHRWRVRQWSQNCFSPSEEPATHSLPGPQSFSTAAGIVMSKRAVTSLWFNGPWAVSSAGGSQVLVYLDWTWEAAHSLGRHV